MPHKSDEVASVESAESKALTKMFRDRMQDLGIDQSELSRKTGINRSVLNRLLNNHMPINLGYARIIARHLELTLPSVSMGVAASTPQASRPALEAFLEANARDLSPRDCEVLRGVRLPEDAESVMDDPQFWQDLLASYRRSRARHGS